MKPQFEIGSNAMYAYGIYGMPYMVYDQYGMQPWYTSIELYSYRAGRGSIEPRPSMTFGKYTTCIQLGIPAYFNLSVHLNYLVLPFSAQPFITAAFIKAIARPLCMSSASNRELRKGLTSGHW